jgi:hypothetical protein
MTRKHFEAIAQVIADERTNWEADPAVGSALTYLAEALADVFAEENPRFDRARFLKAAAETGG